MDKLFNSGISIEEMAAFLDGNLSASDMQKMSSLIEKDDSLKEIIELSDQIDDNLINESSDTFDIPFDILSTEFQLPEISFEEYSNEHTQFGFDENFDVGQQDSPIEDMFSQETLEFFIDNDFSDDDHSIIDDADEIQNLDDIDNLI